jgi:quercetin dioxygenase-like cupin family protein
MMLRQWGWKAIGLCVLLTSAWGSGAAADERQTTKEEERPLTKVTVQAFDKVEIQQFPWGWIRWLMNGEIDPDAEMTFGMVYIKPHQENPAHLHPNSAEFLHVLEGSCEHLVGDRWVLLKKGDTVRIPQDVPHRARTTDQPCKAVILYNTGQRQFVAVQEDGEVD